MRVRAYLYIEPNTFQHQLVLESDDEVMAQNITEEEFMTWQDFGLEHEAP